MQKMWERKFYWDDSMALVSTIILFWIRYRIKAIFQWMGNGKKHFLKAVFAFWGWSGKVCTYPQWNTDRWIWECNKIYPIYECFHNQERICLCPAPVGSAAAVQILEYLIAGGDRNYFCRFLQWCIEDIPENRFLIPVSALRDEELTCYLPPSEIKISTAGIVQSICF